MTDTSWPRKTVTVPAEVLVNLLADAERAYVLEGVTEADDLDRFLAHEALAQAGIR